jgi:hypothetical protein
VCSSDLFFSQRDTFIVSDVALLTYFVFFMSSSDLYTPIFASEDVELIACFACAATVGRLFNTTGVQSWQSGAA